MLKEYKTILPLVRKHWRKYAVGLLFLFAANIGQLYIPQIIQQAIDTISNSSFTMEIILEAALIMVGISVVIAVSRFGWRYFIHGASRRIERDLRKQLFGHMILLSDKFYGGQKTGDLMARATNDMRAIRMSTGIGLVAFLDGIFLASAILIVLFTQYPQVAIYTIIPLPLVTTIILIMGPQIGKQFKKVQDAFGKVSEIAQESLSGIKVIKAFTHESHILGKFQHANRVYEDRNIGLVRIFGFIFPLVGFLAGCTIVALLITGGPAVIEGRLTTGEFVAVISYLEMLIWPMLGVGFTVNMLQRGGASLKRINEVLNHEPEITSIENAKPVESWSSISFKNVDFAFDQSDDLVLKDICLDLQKGKSLGILGRTGSGKSTLIDLLCRLKDPVSGEILLDGEDIQSLDLSQFRGLFGLVPQQTFLFSASIRENIGFAVDNPSEEQLMQAAELSTIAKDFKEFPQGWETQVGEKGITLSGGQKQRVAISRALMADPEILIFDDALSAVDTSTEETILKGFLELREGKTNVLISHRISTLQFADSIIVLEKGKIIQQGSHEELLEAEGLYQDIAQLQSLQEGVRG
jgi:ATP-binding cassette subfamily B multidrug efflux pump